MSEITNYDGALCVSLMSLLALSTSIAAGVLYCIRRDKKGKGIITKPHITENQEYTSEYAAFYGTESEP